MTSQLSEIESLIERAAGAAGRQPEAILQRLTEQVKRLIETGTGVRPAFADNLPRASRRDNRITVNGLYRHGFLLSPATAREVAALALGDETRKGDFR